MAGVELGEQIEVRRAARSGVVVSVRLSPEDADLLHDIAEANGKTISQVAREGLSRYLRRRGGATAYEAAATRNAAVLLACQVEIG